jgi:hypothetical protein
MSTQFIHQLHRIVRPLMVSFGAGSLIFQIIVKKGKQPLKFPAWTAL